MAFAPTTLGFAYFATTKLVGYSLAGAYLRHRFGTARPHPIVFGLARTAVGVAAGVVAAMLFLSVAAERTVFFYALLVPIRFLEWYVVLLLFFGRPQPTAGFSVDSTSRFHVAALNRQEHFLFFSGLGILWSYVLDLPAVLSLFVIPGGTWIC